MTFKPKVIKEQSVYANRWIQVYERTVQTQEGDHPKAYYVVGKQQRVACVLALDNDNNVILTKQYRFAVDDSTLDLPGGGVHPDEQPIEAARRELQEETGFIADQVNLLAQRYLDSGQKDSIQYIYLARELKSGPQHLDKDENIQVVKRNIHSLQRDVLSGKYLESSLMLAVLLYSAREKA